MITFRMREKEVNWLKLKVSPAGNKVKWIDKVVNKKAKSVNKVAKQVSKAMGTESKWISSRAKVAILEKNFLRN